MCGCMPMVGEWERNEGNRTTQVNRASLNRKVGSIYGL